MKQLNLMKFRGFPHLLQIKGTNIDLCNDEQIDVGDELYYGVTGNDGVTRNKVFIVREIEQQRPSKGNWGGAFYTGLVPCKMLGTGIPNRIRTTTRLRAGS